MTHDEIKGHGQKLREIVNMPNSGELVTVPNSEKKMDTGQYERYKKLRELALEVGASHISTSPQKTANEGELAYSIHQALQTASMIETCRIATENYVIAVTATKAAIKNYWIAAAIAILAMLAAWVAVLLR